MKAIGIVLVVTGHLTAFSKDFVTLIFAFHMPLFFFLSGAVAGPARHNSFAAAFKKQSRSLLAPYLVFFVVSWLYWLASRNFAQSGKASGAARPWWEPWLGLAWGSDPALHVNVTLWFFPALFLAWLACAALARIHNPLLRWLLCFSMAAAVLARPPHMPRLPWSIECSAAALPFMLAGRELGPGLFEALKQANPRRCLLGAAVLWAAYAVLALANGRVDLNKLLFGNHPLAYHATAAIGIAALMLTVAWCKPLRISRHLSEHALYIFPTHMLVFALITGFAVLVLKWPANVRDHSLALSAFMAVAALLAGTVTAKAAQWALPQVFGKPQTGHAQVLSASQLTTG